MIIGGAGRPPWPLTFDKVYLFLAAAFTAGYVGIDDTVSVLVTYADSKGVCGLADCDRRILWDLISKLRRKDFFSHTQKSPIYLSEILCINNRSHKAALLVCFFFALRKGEAALIGDKLRIVCCDDSFLLDLRGVVLKSNGTPAVRVKCLCHSPLKDACLHNFQVEVVNLKCIDLLDLTTTYFGTASHSVRVGSVLHLVWVEASAERTVRHLRWSSNLMLIYYRRNIALHKRDNALIDFVY